jgi:hypothetical protein
MSVGFIPFLLHAAPACTLAVVDAAAWIGFPRDVDPLPNPGQIIGERAADFHRLYLL